MLLGGAGLFYGETWHTGVSASSPNIRPENAYIDGNTGTGGVTTVIAKNLYTIDLGAQYKNINKGRYWVDSGKLMSIQQAWISDTGRFSGEETVIIGNSQCIPIDPSYGKWHEEYLDGTHSGRYIKIWFWGEGGDCRDNRYAHHLMFNSLREIQFNGELVPVVTTTTTLRPTTTSTIQENPMGPPDGPLGIIRNMIAGLISYLKNIFNWDSLLTASPLLGLTDAGHYDVGEPIAITSTVSGTEPYDGDFSDKDLTYYYGSSLVYFNGDKIEDSGLVEIQSNKYTDTYTTIGQDGEYAHAVALYQATTTYENGVWNEWSIKEVGKEIKTFQVGIPTPPEAPVARVTGLIQDFIQWLLGILGLI